MVGTLPLPAVLSLTETANWRFFRSKLLPALSLLVIVFYVGSTFVVSDSKESFSRWGIFGALKDSESKCKVQCLVRGTESLPKGIVSATSNLEMRRLWGTSKDQMKRREHSKKSLLAIAVGIRQKKNVDHIIMMVLSINGGICNGVTMYCMSLQSTKPSGGLLSGSCTQM